MPPSGVSPSWNKADNRGSLERRFVGFPHPVADGATVRWVHPAFALPVLLQPVDLRREIAPALGIAWQGTDIEFEAKFGVQKVEDPLGRRPLVGETR